jgi:hypothetical protein
METYLATSSTATTVSYTALASWCFAAAVKKGWIVDPIAQPSTSTTVLPTTWTSHVVVDHDHVQHLRAIDARRPDLRRAQRTIAAFLAS